MNALETGHIVSAGRNSLRRRVSHLQQKSLDDYRLAVDTYRTSTQFKFTEHAWAVSKAVGGI